MGWDENIESIDMRNVWQMLVEQHEESIGDGQGM